MQPFYKRTWFIVLMLIFVFPVGLVLLWTQTNWKRGTKIIITVIVAVIVAYAVFGPSDSDLPKESAPPIVSAAPVPTQPPTPSPLPSATLAPTALPTPPPASTSSPLPVESASPVQTPAPVYIVWVSSEGNRYHANSTCSNMDSPWQVTLDDAKVMGRTACGRCNPQS